MGKVFTKLNIGDIVATSGTRVFKKLTTAEVTPEEPTLPIWNGTDLTGTTWVLNDTLDLASLYDIATDDVGIAGDKVNDYRYLDISFIGSAAGGTTASYTRFGVYTDISNRTGLHYGIVDSEGDHPGVFAYVEGQGWEYYIGAFHFNMSKEIAITGGLSATNTSLIEWLIWNADLVSHQPAHKGGLYDADDNLVASWNALVYAYGMDVEKDYNFFTYDPTRPGVVLTNTTQLSSGVKLLIDSSVNQIGNYAFYGCETLTSVELTRGITTIKASAFANCVNLANVHIPDSVTAIDEYAFNGCTSLASIHIPNSVTEIYAFAFEGCTSLTDVTISEGVVEIHSNAFNDCTSLKSIVIPTSVTTIWMWAFGGCKSLKDVYYRGSEAQWAALEENSASNGYLFNTATKHYNYTG